MSNEKSEPTLLLKNPEFVRERILKTITRLQEKDYAFSVDAQGTPWDVYKFTLNGIRGMTAVRIVDGKLEVGTFRKGDFKPEEVQQQLVETFN